MFARLARNAGSESGCRFARLWYTPRISSPQVSSRAAVFGTRRPSASTASASALRAVTSVGASVRLQ
jgi:hypothetical protein